jgi:hypothetical protein
MSIRQDFRNRIAELEMENKSLREGFDKDGNSAAESCCSDIKDMLSAQVRDLEADLAERTQERDEWRAQAEQALDAEAGLTQDRYALIDERDALRSELSMYKPSASIETGGTK